MGSSLHPDLVLAREADNTAVIIDVAVTFENGLDAFKSVREEKIRKYQNIAKSLRATYKDVSVEAVVVGALGNWDPLNDRVCHRLCSKKHMKLIVLDTVCHSKDIYVQNVSKIPQFQPPQYTGFHNAIAEHALAAAGPSPSVVVPALPSVAIILPAPAFLSACLPQPPPADDLNFEIQLATTEADSLGAFTPVDDIIPPTDITLITQSPIATGLSCIIAAAVDNLHPECT